MFKLTFEIIPLRYYPLVNSLRFIAISVFCVDLYFYNYWNIGLLIFGLGVIFNASAVIANHGLMPVNIDVVNSICYDILTKNDIQAEIKKLDGKIPQHILSDKFTRLRFFIDRFYYFGVIRSFGDFFIDYGRLLMRIQFVCVLILFLVNFLFN